MSIRFQADNDLKRIIIDATLRREPSIDFQTAQSARLDDLDDEAVLRLATLQSRILVSHDKRTMPAALASFIASGGTSPGVLLVIPQNAPIREVVEALILIWADDRASEWNMAQLTTVKDEQAHLRHSFSATTLGHYIKSVLESVRVAVESLDHLLKKAPADSGQPAN